MSTTPRTDEEREYLHDRYAQQVRIIAAELRDLADRVERRSDSKDTITGTAEVLSAVTTTLACLPLAPLVRASHEYVLLTMQH